MRQAEYAESGKDFSLGLKVPPFLAESSTYNVEESGVSFLGQEAGISAYTNIGQKINLTMVKTAFSGIEYQCDQYIIGSVAISGYSKYYEPHVFVHKDGWIVAYFLKEESTTKMINNLMYPSDNKLKNAITSILLASWLPTVPYPDVKYYDFRYPSANALIIIGDKVTSSEEGRIYLYDEWNNFYIKIPKDIADNTFDIKWYLYAKLDAGRGRVEANLYMHNARVGNFQVYENEEEFTQWGEINFVPAEKPVALLQPDELNVDTKTSVSVYINTTELLWGYNYYAEARGGILITCKIGG
jgi:hypothetical protein